MNEIDKLFRIIKIISKKDNSKYKEFYTIKNWMFTVDTHWLKSAMVINIWKCKKIDLDEKLSLINKIKSI